MPERIIVIGSGIVAHMVAYLLAKQAYQVILFSPNYKVNVPRAYAINAENIRWLQSVGVWGEALSSHSAPFSSIAVWEDEPYQLEFVAHEMGLASMGSMVFETDFLHDLGQAIARESGIEKIAEPVVDIDVSCARVQTEKGHYQGDWLIAADGGRSSVRQMLQAQVTCHDYEQSALVGLVQHEKHHHKRLRQRFLPEGPLALLALQDPYQSALVWSMSHAKAKTLLEMNNDSFSAQLTKASSSVLGHCSPASALGAFPLVARHTKQYWQDRLLFVGDAAHTVHPLAGQGLNYSLEDVQAMMSCFEAIDQSGRAFGDAFFWSQYAKRRYTMNQRRIQTLSAINRLFLSQRAGISSMRQLGMMFLQRCPVIKRALMAEACGLSNV